jgi:hypothetical protein
MNIQRYDDKTFLLFVSRSHIQHYYRQPTGFVDTTGPDHVYRLNHSIRFETGPATVVPTLRSFAATVRFSCSKSDTSAFVLHNTLATAYLLHYIDKIILTASSTVLLEGVITTLNFEFAMTHVGYFHNLLGIAVSRMFSGMFLS